ncbi:MAG: aquaporin [Fibromonadales bacterium]|nr:aquaporin [Fibromonadales bacterium]
MKKYIAELIGTFSLVFFGCGSAVFAGSQVGLLGISFAFGLVIVGMAYAIGPISGCHINPAVTIGALTAGRINVPDAIGYIVSQLAGAVIGSAALVAIANGNPALAGNFGQNVVNSNYTLLSGILFETIATFIFVFVILGATHKNADSKFAGLAIGFTLVLIHIVGIPITKVSVNPARSFGPALFACGDALAQLWIFIVFPILGGVLAGALFKYKALTQD